MRETDLTLIQAAYEARDDAALVQIGARVGLTLDLARVHALELCGAMTLGQVIAAIEEARFGELGIAVREAVAPDDTYCKRVFCLAVRRDDVVIVQVQPHPSLSASLSQAWPELRPWFKELARNQENADRWAATTARGRTSFHCGESLRPPEPTQAEAALIQQIVETPDDPAPRQVLADALLERDEIRGELIHLEDRIAAATDHVEEDRLIDRRDALLQRHGRRLAGEIAEHVDSYSWKGGMVDMVVMSAGGFRKHGERLFSNHPIRKLLVRPLNDPAITTLAKCAHLGLVRALEFSPANGRVVRFPRSRARRSTASRSSPWREPQSTATRTSTRSRTCRLASRASRSGTASSVVPVAGAILEHGLVRQPRATRPHQRAALQRA